MGTAETRAPPAHLSATYGFSLVRIVAASVSGIPVVAIHVLASYAELHGGQVIRLRVDQKIVPF